MARKTVTVDINVVCTAINEWKWMPVFLQTMYYDHDNMTAWLTDNCVKRSVSHAAAFVFEDSQDAMLFALRWGYLRNI